MPLDEYTKPSDRLIFWPLQPASYPENRRFPYTIGKPYLAGMEIAKVAAEVTDPSARERLIYWNHDIYQYPDRFNQTPGNVRFDQTTGDVQIPGDAQTAGDVQTPGDVKKKPGDVPNYTMAHDIYSLGVVLLEIGLWKPIATMQEEFKLDDPASWKEKLIAICKGNVAIQVGKAYAQVVENCLNCGNSDSPASESYARDVFEKLEALSTATRGNMSNPRFSWSLRSALDMPTPVCLARREA